MLKLKMIVNFAVREGAASVANDSLILAVALAWDHVGAAAFRNRFTGFCSLAGLCAGLKPLA
jgi:hypothetical protein